MFFSSNQTKVGFLTDTPPYPTSPPSYFDWRIDEVNDASKPIPSGLIAPDKALLAACALYGLLLALACVVPNAGTRQG